MTPVTDQVARCEHDAGRFDRNVGSCTDGDTDIGSGECRGVVDPFADHRHGLSTILEFGDLRVLVLGEHFGEHLVDVELAGDGVGHLSSVAGDHRNTDVAVVEGADRIG